MFEIFYYAAFIWVPLLFFWDIKFFGKKYIGEVAAIQGIAFLKIHSEETNTEARKEYKKMAIKHLLKLLAYFGSMFIIAGIIFFLAPEIWLYWITVPTWAYLIVLGVLRLILANFPFPTVG